MHRNASRQAWLNDAIGMLGILPYMAPFYLEKWFHLQHHALLNRREDPNFIYTDGPYWQMPLRYLRVLRFARERMRDDPRSRAERWLDRVPPALALVVVVAALWPGALRRPRHPLAAALRALEAGDGLVHQLAAARRAAAGPLRAARASSTSPG